LHINWYQPASPDGADCSEPEQSAPSDMIPGCMKNHPEPYSHIFPHLSINLTHYLYLLKQREKPVPYFPYLTSGLNPDQP